MDRTACVSVPALPLQALIGRHPDWKDQPAVVVDRDKPQGVILWVNEAARRHRILPGMRYATGLSLTRELRGGVVPETEVEGIVRGVTERLWRFSPRVEPSPREPGVFWLDAGGLRHVFPDLGSWVAQIRDDLDAYGYFAVVAVGFSRFGSFAAARSRPPSRRDNVVFDSKDAERAYLRQVPVERLGIDPALRDRLFKLGVRTLGAFMALPAAGVARRFGPEAYELYRSATEDTWRPMTPAPIYEPVEAHRVLDFPVTDVMRLMLIAGASLRPMLETLAERHEALSALLVTLSLDDGETRHEHVQPATPAVETKPILTLLRLRLEGLALSSGVVEFSMKAEGATLAEGQMALFHDGPRADLEAVHEAFAKLRAEHGNDAVLRARLYEGHLPEAQFGWERFEEPVFPNPTETALTPLVRRISAAPVALPTRARHEPDGWMIARLADGPVEEVVGPHVISGGWWARRVTRAYYYVRTRSGRWLWVYEDRERQRWFLQGEVQ